MKYEMVVGLSIIDEQVYQSYRDAMIPILKSYGGGFRYDFKVSDALKNAGGQDINRVFTIHFESKESMDLFFSNPRYLEVKNQFFEKSVAATTIISSYEVSN